MAGVHVHTRCGFCLAFDCARNARPSRDDIKARTSIHLFVCVLYLRMVPGERKKNVTLPEEVSTETRGVDALTSQVFPINPALSGGQRRTALKQALTLARTGLTCYSVVRRMDETVQDANPIQYVTKRMSNRTMQKTLVLLKRPL